jgi:phytoene desaturase
MKNKKSVAIIGAGIGGLTTAIYLAQEGFKVRIYEKNSFAGGRCGNFYQEGHRFDIGATLLMIPEVYQNTFAAMGKNMFGELELYRMDPVYRLIFDKGRKLTFTSDLAKMEAQLEAIESGSFTRFLKFLDQSISNYKLSMKAIIEKNYYHFYDFFNLKNLLVLLKVKALKNHYKLASRYFKSDVLRYAFTFQNIYVGQNPFKASAVFAMLPFLEITEGVYYPKGGMYSIIERLLSICYEKGVEILYNAPVSKIETENNRVKGISLKDNGSYPADIIISNADLPFVYRELLPDGGNKKRMNRLKYTCSAVVFHWGMDCSFPELTQHNVFVAPDYRKSIQAVFNGDVYHPNYSFYLHAPAKSDPTAAPEGQDSITVIVPIANLKASSDNNWQKIKLHIKQIVIQRLKEEGLPDFESHIKFEKCFLQNAWKSIFNLSEGATFGSLNHNIMQMGYMRPHNQHKKYKNLFFVGGSTHPGNGVPMALISARLTTEKVLHSNL